MSQNEIVRFALNNRWLEEQGVPDMNAPAAIAALKNAKPDRMDGGTESKPSGSFFTTGQRPQANWNRPCTEPYAGWCGTRELTTPGDPILLLFLHFCHQ